MSVFSLANPGFAEESKTQVADEKKADPAESANPDPNLPAADEILNQARTKLEGLESLKCDLHQTALIAGMKLQASGTYVEAAGDKVRLELNIFALTPMKTADGKSPALDAPAPEHKDADSRGTLLQVCDGTVVHTSWKNGDKQTLFRRNLRDIQASVAGVEKYDAQSVAMDLGVGGLRGLVARLQKNMLFVPVKMEKNGDRDTYEITGRWNDRVRKEVFQLPEGTVVDSRPFVPEYVKIYVDRESLLIRRIQFWKRSIDQTQKMARPLLTLDLRNLQLNEQVDPQIFSFTPPENAAEEDQTEAIIQAIKQGLNPPPAGQPPTGQAPAK
ncbi:MAG: hypothetical protein U0996_24055 [Planctomycetaceae bacterium]